MKINCILADNIRIIVYNDFEVQLYLVQLYHYTVMFTRLRHKCVAHVLFMIYPSFDLSCKLKIKLGYSCIQYPSTYLQ